MVVIQYNCVFYVNASYSVGVFNVNASHFVCVFKEKYISHRQQATEVPFHLKKPT
jgi:hypothetical protein